MSSSPNATSSSEVYGWMAAIGSMLAFGSFGVPIKSRNAIKLDVDPLVFQSYKTAVCFATCWFVLTIPGESITFTPWGIVSALFWVPGGVAAVYAIKTAGLALALGVSSSLIVLVSAFWGIVIFGEPVQSPWGTGSAILCMMLGLAGMSYYASPESSRVKNRKAERPSFEKKESDLILDDNNIDNDDERHRNEDMIPSSQRSLPARHRHAYREGVHNNNVGITIHADEEHARTVPRKERSAKTLPQSLKKNRKTGILAAVFNGAWGGSIMAPMKFCQSDATKGVGYLISFSVGATIVTLFLWLLRYMHCLYKYRSVTVAYHNLPSFHLRKMWLPGSLSGLLWSTGNFFSLIAVYYLGEGVGYPAVQTSMLVSGLWGIFYFREIQGRERVTKWIFSSLLTLAGIVLLSYQHHAASLDD